MARTSSSMVSGSDITIEPACGEISRVFLDNFPIGAAGALWCAGDDFAIHDGVERAVNHQGIRDGQHHIAMPNDQCLGLGEAVTAEAIACHQHPQHIITALASVVETGKPLLGPSQWLRGICAGAEPGDQKEDVVWFALNDDRPLFAFGGSGPNSGATEARSQNRSPALTSSTVS
jgi:hypothetical protein